MLNLKNIINNPEEIKRKLKTKGVDSKEIDEIFELSFQRSSVMHELQQLESRRNKLSKEIGLLKSKNESAEMLLNEVGKIKEDIEKIKEGEKNVNKDINIKLLYIPNIPLEDTPVGNSEDDNVVIKEHIIGRGKVLDVKPHYEIAKELDIVDFERAVKMSGARFWAYKKEGAKLVRALENFMLDSHIKKGYIELKPPLIVNENIMVGTGQLPKFKDDAFKIEGRNSYLIPTAEVPLTNYYSNEIINLSKTISFTAFTPCFRAEAGSGGKDTKGLIRAHQFNKVELVKITKKEDAEKEFETTLKDAKSILDQLELTYRELSLCTGDLGFSSQKTIDLEVWIPSENKYREISSVSSFGDFQARRAKIRYKDLDGKNQYANTINGSALAIDRTIAALLENYQNNDGTITIPKVLIPYMGIEKI